MLIGSDQLYKVMKPESLSSDKRCYFDTEFGQLKFGGTNKEEMPKIARVDCHVPKPTEMFADLVQKDLQEAKDTKAEEREFELNQLEDGRYEVAPTEDTNTHVDAKSTVASLPKDSIQDLIKDRSIPEREQPDNPQLQKKEGIVDNKEVHKCDVVAAIKSPDKTPGKTVSEPVNISGFEHCHEWNALAKDVKDKLTSDAQAQDKSPLDLAECIKHNHHGAPEKSINGLMDVRGQGGKSEVFTKQKVLRVITSVFDPVGLTEPIKRKWRRVTQRFWNRSSGWDEPIPPDLKNRNFAHDTPLRTRSVQNLIQLEVADERGGPEYVATQGRDGTSNTNVDCPLLLRAYKQQS